MKNIYEQMTPLTDIITLANGERYIHSSYLNDEIIPLTATEDTKADFVARATEKRQENINFLIKYNLI